MIPLPFARCELRIGQPVVFPKDATDAQRETLRQLLESRMRALTED